MAANVASEGRVLLLLLLQLGALTSLLAVATPECEEKYRTAIQECEKVGTTWQTVNESLQINGGNLLEADKTVQDYVTCLTAQMGFIVNGEMANHRAQCCDTRDEEDYQIYRALCKDKVKDAEDYMKGPVVMTCIAENRISMTSR
ncbi:hypothetical protein R5R35_008815 [Gryllus longicercus]|uniref:Odorant binding protein n=1 Tax=Gryllus longicercus TaxID=2509291 RepID=A0AAN9Z1B0_9ORTH